MNKLQKRGYEGVGSDIAEKHVDVVDGFPIITMPYILLDITVMKAIQEVRPDVVVHYAAWTTEDDDEVEKIASSMLTAHRMLRMLAKQ